MRDARPTAIYLKDYQPPDYLVERTELHFDLRMTPGGDNQAVREEIAGRLAAIAQQRALDIELRSLVKDIAPFEQAADSELVRLAERLTGHRAEAVAFATEAPFLQALGMETIVMGPGSIDRAHQPDEYPAFMEHTGNCARRFRLCHASASNEYG